MKRFAYGWVVATALLPMSWAQAQISYSYLEGALTVHEADTPFAEDEGGIGLGFKGSYEVMPILHVFGSVQAADFDDINLQTTVVQAGVGTHYDFSETKSVFLNVSVLTTDLDLDDPILGSLSADDDGYGLSVGYREVNHTPLEFRLSIDHISLNDSDTSETTMDISLQYEINQRLKILGGLQFGGDDGIFRAGVRYYLGDDN